MTTAQHYHQELTQQGAPEAEAEVIAGWFADGFDRTERSETYGGQFHFMSYDQGRKVYSADLGGANPAEAMADLSWDAEGQDLGIVFSMAGASVEFRIRKLY